MYCMNNIAYVKCSLRQAVIQPTILPAKPNSKSLPCDQCQVQYRTNLHPGTGLPSDPAGDEWCWDHCRQARSHARMHQSLHSTSTLQHNLSQISTRDMYTLTYNDSIKGSTSLAWHALHTRRYSEPPYTSDACAHTFMASLFVSVASRINSTHLS